MPSATALPWCRVGPGHFRATWWRGPGHGRWTAEIAPTYWRIEGRGSGYSVRVEKTFRRPHSATAAKRRVAELVERHSLR